MNQPRTAIVLLTYNSVNYLQQFLPQLVNLSPDWATIYIIDNASNDESKTYIEANHPSVKWIQLTENLGFAGGYAEGLKSIEEEYWVLVNSDVEVKGYWLEPLIDRLVENDSLAAVQPKIKSYKQKDYFEHSGAAGGYMDYLGYPFCRGRIFDSAEDDNGQYDDYSDCFWTSGACMALKKEAYFAAGGFDPRFFMHMEEIDLCWRMQRLDYTIACEPKSTVYHVGGGTLPYESPQKFYYNFRNNLILLQKNLPLYLLVPVLFVRCLLDWFAAFRELLSGKVKNTVAVGQAWLSFLLGIPKWRNQFNHSTYKPIKIIYKKLIIVDFFLLNHRKFSSLRHENGNYRS